MNSIGSSVAGEANPARRVRFAVLWCGRPELGFSRRFGTAKTIAAAVAVVCGLAALLGQDSAIAQTTSPFEHAELYVDRYFESDESPNLSEAGKRKSEALALYTRGLLLENKGDDGGAAEVFSKVLEILPGEVNLANRVGFLLAQNGETGEGLKVLKEFLANNPDEPKGYLNLSIFLATFHSGDDAARKKALEVAEEASEKFPNSAPVCNHLVNLYMEARRRDDAEEVVNRAIESKSKSAGYWMQIAAIALRVWPPQPGATEDLERINDIYAKALALGKGNLALEAEVAQFYHGSRQLERARDLYLGIIEEHPETLEVRGALAEVYAAMGDADKVLETLLDLAQINPGDLNSQKKLARIYLGQAQELQGQIALDETKLPLLEEKLDRSIEHFLNSLAIAKGTVDEYIQVGQLLRMRDRADEAVQLLERAVFFYPEVGALVQQLAFSCSIADQHEEAIGHFEKAVTLFKQENADRLDAEFYFQFGAAVEQRKDYERAEKLFQQSMAKLAEDDIESPRNKRLASTLYNYLGYMWLERDRNIDEAGELIRTAYELDPKSGAIADSMGWFYFKKGDYEKARTELVKASKIMPDGVVFDHLAQTVFALGELDEAIEYLREALKHEPLPDDLKQIEARLKEYQATDPAKMQGKKKADSPADKEKKDEPSDAPPKPANKPAIPAKPAQPGQPARAA